MNTVISSADLGDVITLQNPTRYVAFLESGETTPRAPVVSGWIALTAAAWPQIVRRAVARVRARGRAQ
jgi:hypothetical protein